MRALANGCPNLETIDFSGSKFIDSYLLECFILEANQIKEFIVL